MRKLRTLSLLLCLVLLVGERPASAAISSAPIQEVPCNAGSGTTITCTIANPAAGNALILACGANPNTATISTSGVSGGGISNWTKAVGGTTNRTAEIWYGTNSSGSGTSVTVTVDNTLSGTGGLCNISEWSGIQNSSPLDGTAAASGGTSQTPSTSSITLSNAGSLIIAMERGGHTSFSSGPTSSFNALTSPTPASFQAAYRLPGSTGSYSTTWTFTISNVYNTAIAAFKPASAAATQKGSTFVIQ